LPVRADDLAPDQAQDGVPDRTTRQIARCHELFRQPAIDVAGNVEETGDFRFPSVFTSARITCRPTWLEGPPAGKSLRQLLGSSPDRDKGGTKDAGTSPEIATRCGRGGCLLPAAFGCPELLRAGGVLRRSRPVSGGVLGWESRCAGAIGRVRRYDSAVRRLEFADDLFRLRKGRGSAGAYWFRAVAARAT